MSKKTLLDPKNPFSPGELVLLNGEIFAKKVMMGNFQLMHTDASVSYAQLGDAILTSAFLAIESTKDLRFEIRAEKAMLGLRKVKSVYVQKTSNENLWPEYSPEFQFLNIMEVFDKDGENAKVSDLIYSWLQQDSSSPWQSVIAMVQSGLAERSLLEKTETTRLKVFTTANYSLPESTAELVKEFSINPIQEMMNNYQENRSEFWDLLKKENKKAIKQRTAQDDMDFD